MKNQNITLHFGVPFYGEIHEIVTSCSINHDLSFEKATISVYKHMTESLLSKREGERSYFDHLLSDCFQKDVISPSIQFATFREMSHVFPLLVLHSDFAIEARTGRKLFIENSSIDYVGSSFGSEFEIEYFGYDRKLGYTKRSIDATPKYRPSNAPTVAEKWQTIYLLGNKRHIFDGECFIEVA
jgi:hypothetical protein